MNAFDWMAILMVLLALLAVGWIWWTGDSESGVKLSRRDQLKIWWLEKRLERLERLKTELGDEAAGVRSELVNCDVARMIILRRLRALGCGVPNECEVPND